MYSVLLVDDDVQEVEAVHALLPVEELGLSPVCHAHSMRQAQALLSAQSFDILLCDIEMPNGSGLELLSWLQRSGYATVSVLLTCHADFRYARQAVQLGCLDYLLKPVAAVELAQALRKATGVVAQSEAQRKENSYQALWQKNYSLVIESFWLNLINSESYTTEFSIEALIENVNLPITMDMRFLPLLATVQRYIGEVDNRRRIIAEHAVKRFLQENVSEPHSGQIVKLNQNTYLVILLCNQAEALMIQGLQNDCRTFLEACRDLPCELSCSIGQSTSLISFAEQVRQLVAQEKQYALGESVRLFSRIKHDDAQSRIPNLSLWASLLKNHRSDEALGEITNYLEQSAYDHRAGSAFLKQFIRDYEKLLRDVLTGAETESFFQENGLLNAADETIALDEVLAYVKTTAHSLTGQGGSSDDIIQKVRQYIAVHLDEDDMSRETIANRAFLSPDYLTKLFKKKTGVTLSDYIINERMKTAKELLTTTQLSVSTIASAVGYTHFSHFAKMFKKNTGLSPKDYRMRMSERKG